MPAPPAADTVSERVLSRLSRFEAGMSPASVKTASRCTTETAQGTHVFEIVGYSLKRGIGVGKFVNSSIFAIGGYDWAIRFYPDGLNEDSKEYVSVYLELMSKDAEVRARYSLRLISRARAPSKCPSEWCSKLPILFKSSDSTRYSRNGSEFLLKSKLENKELGYLREDCLAVECDLAVIKESELSDISVKSEIEVPPCDISAHYAKLLDQED
ncbi:hypothetical protein ACP4OV_026899 [Aristida adscensionis]